jgi:hypothetical protein
MGFFSMFKSKGGEQSNQTKNQVDGLGGEDGLGEAWVCVYKFCPWDPELIDVEFSLRPIATVKKDGSEIRVECEGRSCITGYTLESPLGKMENIGNTIWIGVFPTEQDAKIGYNKLVMDFVGVMESKMVEVTAQ